MERGAPLTLKQLTQVAQHREAVVGFIILVSGMVASIAFAEVPQPRPKRYLQSATLKESLVQLSKLRTTAKQTSDTNVETARCTDVAGTNPTCAGPAN